MSRLYTVSDPERAAQADVVFVHGLGGDPLTTWCHDAKNQKDSWPIWLAADRLDLAIHCLGYNAAPSAWLGSTMPLVDRATNVLTRFETAGIGRRPVVFICHSLGGLVIKQCLRSALDLGEPAWQKLVENTKGMLFLATPHTGASPASLTEYLGALGTILRLTVSVQELEANTPMLRNLNIWYRNNARVLGITTLALFETQNTKGVRVVDETRADAGIGVPRAVDADHFSICKPGSCRDLVYEIGGVFLESSLPVSWSTRQERAGSTGTTDTGHERITARLLGDEAVTGFLAALKKEIVGEFQPDSAPETPEEIVRWFSQSPKDQDEIRRLFDVVHRALLASNEMRGGGGSGNRTIEEAAAALYCLVACRLVNRAAHCAGTYLLQVPRTEAVIYAVIATALFGGELRLKPAEQLDFPTSDFVFEVPIPAGGHCLETDFERAAYVALFQNDRDVISGSLDAGSLDPDKRELLLTRLRNLRQVRRVSFALVVQGVADGKPLQEFADEHQVPVLIPDDTANALLLIKPSILRAQIREFWAELRSSNRQEKAPQKPPSAKGPTDMPSSGISITTGDGATIAFTTGDQSPAHARRREGIDPTAFRQALQELIDAIKAEPAGETRDALVAQVEAAKGEIEKTKPDAALVRGALDTVDQVVKKGAGILESGEKIAGLLYRAYNHLSSFLDLPSAS